MSHTTAQEISSVTLAEKYCKNDETTEDEIFRRVAKGIAQAEPTKALRTKWEKLFYENMKRGAIGAGRIMSSAGTDINATYINCFSGDTIVFTENGPLPIKQLVNTKQQVQSIDAIREAEFRSFGVQRIYEVLFENGQVIKTTLGHQWVVRQLGITAISQPVLNNVERVTTENLLYRQVPVMPYISRPAKNDDYLKGIAHGIIYGDGSRARVQANKYFIHLFEHKQELIKYLEPYAQTIKPYTGYNKHSIYVYGVNIDNNDLKTLPYGQSLSYLYGFICGLIATDGNVCKGNTTIFQSNYEELEVIYKILLMIGMTSSPVNVYREYSPYTGEYKPSFVLRIKASSIYPDDILRSDHKEKLNYGLKKVYTNTVIGITDTGEDEEVFCAVEPVTNTFTIEGGLLTGNCFVFLVADQIQGHDADGNPGIYEALKEAAETMRRGGGVGYDFSLVRPKNAEVKGTQSFASGPCSYINVFDVSCETVESAGCFVGETLIDTTEGLVSIKTIVESSKDWHVNTHLGPRKVTAKFISGMKPIYNVTTEHGFNVKVSPDHKFAQYNDYVGDIITVAIKDIMVSDNKTLLLLEQGGTVIDTDVITSVIGEKEQETYDLEVEEVHLLSGNGIYTSNSRRGAQLASLRIDHPDVKEYIVAKRTKGRWNNFNVSVFVTDAFIEAVKNKAKWQLVHKAKPSKMLIDKGAYQREDGIWVYEEVEATALWDSIMQSNYDFAEPGILFGDNINNDNNLRYVETIGSCNPCIPDYSIVQTSNGPKQVKDLIRIPFEAMVDGEAYECKTGFFPTGNKPVYRLETHQGYHLDLTADHKVRTIIDGKEDWKEAKDFIDGDIVLIHNHDKDVNKNTKAVFKSLSYIDNMDVYDCTVEDVHMFDINGVKISNCAEEPLPPYGCCDLGPIVLPKFVKEPFTSNARFNYDALMDAVRIQVRFLDNVLDTTYWPLEQQKKESDSKRRIGVGFTGLGDTLIMLNKKYNSFEGLSIAKNISMVMRDTAYIASVELAKEKGPFPLFKHDKYLEDGTFASRLPEDIKVLIRQHGIRNSHLLSIAPCGTVSLAFADNASNGVEPPFSLAYTRKKRLQHGGHKDYIVMDHALRVYLSTLTDKQLADNILTAVTTGNTSFTHDGKELTVKESLPESFITALEMSTNDHLQMLATVQPYIDTSISKTVNVAADYPFDDFKDIYFKAHAYKLKGVATYRPNSILGSVLSEIKAEPTKVEPVPAKLNPIESFHEFMNLDHEKRPPGRLEGCSVQYTYYNSEGEVKFYLGVSYITTDIGLDDGSFTIAKRPIEIFINSEMNVGNEWSKLLGITMSQMARTSLYKLSKYLKTCLKMRSDRGSIRFGYIQKSNNGKAPRYHGSDIAVMAYAIQDLLHSEGIFDEHGNPVTFVHTPAIQYEGDIVYGDNEASSTVVEEAAVTVATGSVCTECGSPSVIKRDGCKFCTNCGWEGSCG